ncbi:lipid droplet-associated hydrolase isoform X2 [Pseudonaja textilis]|uniref:lipid droplet-associated hydrolase isoform X2 n=1 Tax=Pseudonaja textilis TaxID=8673 RepID=UPI000EAAC0DA|nr:lipid droplet-associated hydrolase isoform X2 [Pseudonaja textilis]
MLRAAGREPLNGEASMNSDSKEQDLIREEFTYISGALTQILKCGPWEDLWNDKSAPRLLFLVIPGNPGLPDFYRTFIETLYYSLNQQYPVWVVSHGGHCKIPHEIKRKEEMLLNDTDDVFGLQGQAEHKLKFLRKYVPKDVKLVLIGHSIGSYFVLEIMKHSPELEILRSILLFPTIERMAESPQGRLLTPLLCQLRYILYIPIYLATLLPERVKSFLVRFALNQQKWNDQTLVTTITNLLNMDCIANIMYLASQEMRSVKERDNSTIKQHLNKLIFYYGTTDSWCPLQYYEEMKMEFLDGDIRICEKGIRHSFVLDSSKEMAEMIVGWIQNDLAKL